MWESEIFVAMGAAEIYWRRRMTGGKATVSDFG
jgi:hypothetical protein